MASAAFFLLQTAQVGKAIYLGDDDALDQTVALWAESLVGDDPSADGVWRRAAELSLYGTVDAIDDFVRGERSRLRLRALRNLPPKGGRTIEMLNEAVAVLLHDKALLDEEDMLPASLLVYGKSATPLVRRIGSRWFLTPGTTGPTGGVAVLDDSSDEVRATIFTADGRSVWRDTLTLQKPARFVVRGPNERGPNERDPDESGTDEISTGHGELSRD
jgi:hypothetical protein